MEQSREFRRYGAIYWWFWSLFAASARDPGLSAKIGRNSLRRILTLIVILFVASAARANAAQFDVTRIVIDKDPTADGARGDSLEKVVDFFTDASRTNPSVVLGHGNYPSPTGGGMYLYTNSGDITGTWTMTRIGQGVCYEGARAITFAGDSFPNVVASCDDRIVLFLNPANSGGNPKGMWRRTILRSDAGAHEIRVADIDLDGKADVICSASAILGEAPNFILYQNSKTSWQLVRGPSGIQDSIDIMSIEGGPRNNIVGPAANGTGIKWFSYPGSRTGTWRGHLLGDGSPGIEIGVGVDSDGKDYVVAASNELYPDPWRTGLAYYTQPSNPTQPWVQHVIDTSWRAVHQINTGAIGGVPYFIAAEQEQACTKGMADNHPGTPCRVTLFYKDGSGFTPFQIFDHGTQNQDVIPFRDGILLVGANHTVYRAAGHPELQAWSIVPRPTTHKTRALRLP